MKKRKTGVFFVILFVVFALVGCNNEEAIYQEAYIKGHEAGYNVACNEKSKEINDLQAQIEQLINCTIYDDCFYFAEAFIMSQEKMPDDSYCVCWNVNYSNVQVFLTYIDKPLEEDVPYLLTMFNMGTKDVLDDEVAVIWAAVG